MKLQILLDMEDFDENDLFGEIRLLDGKNAIVESNAYIQSWIDGLNEAIDKLEQNSRVEIDLIEEPKPLVFEKAEKGIRISYGNAFVFAENTNDIDSAIKEELKRVKSTLSQKRPFSVLFSRCLKTRSKHSIDSSKTHPQIKVSKATPQIEFWDTEKLHHS